MMRPLLLIWKTEKAGAKRLYLRKKTVPKIIIAHRVSAVQKADYILVLNKGEIVEQGNSQPIITTKKECIIPLIMHSMEKGGASIGC